jgi:hypothetical protein
MFFSDPQFDREVLLVLLGASVVIGAAVGLLRKNVWLGLLLVSILGNVSVVLVALSGTLMFSAYGLELLKIISGATWPILNVIFLVSYVLYVRKKNRAAKV